MESGGQCGAAAEPEDHPADGPLGWGKLQVAQQAPPSVKGQHASLSAHLTGGGQRGGSCLPRGQQRPWNLLSGAPVGLGVPGIQDPRERKGPFPAPLVTCFQAWGTPPSLELPMVGQLCLIGSSAYMGSWTGDSTFSAHPDPLRRGWPTSLILTMPQGWLQPPESLSPSGSAPASLPGLRRVAFWSQGRTGLLLRNLRG